MKTLNLQDLRKVSGIYKIVCSANNKFYYGASTNLYCRRNNHCADLKHNRHKNPIMQNCYNKYGKSSFTFELIETCILEDLFIKEQEYLDKYVGTTDCMNINKSADHSRLGCKHTQESKDKMTASRMGLKPSEETRAKLRLAKGGVNSPRYGKPIHPETKKILLECRVRNYEFISPTGDLTKIRNLAQFCKDFILSYSMMFKVSKGIAKHHKGWTKPI